MWPRPSYAWVKRDLDVILSLTALLVLSPLLLACIAAIRLNSPGPAVFAQQRTGKDGHRFRMYKFRTMVRNADELKESLRHLSVVPPPDFKIPNDPRITTVGTFLRKSSLDELPQLVNILKGEMSIVGPRPISIPLEQHAVWEMERLDVRPGLTGLWQVEGRNVASFRERARLDIRYIRHMSLRTDARLVGRTILTLPRGAGM